jgi:hypothetical protein
MKPRQSNRTRGAPNLVPIAKVYGVWGAQSKQDCGTLRQQRDCAGLKTPRKFGTALR